GNLIRASIPNSAEPANPAVPPNTAQNPNEAAPPPLPPVVASADSQPPAPGAQPSPSLERNKIDEFMENRASQKFSGKPITLQVRDVDVSDVLRLIGD